MNIDIKSSLNTLLRRIEPLKRYSVPLFVLLIVGLYGFLVMQTNAATSVEPSPDQQLAATKRAPNVDPETVRQLQQLQDNSVSVQALFNEARSNPFE
ncbi:MAG TPA: hypothetical protein VGE30_00535 [Candidatus Saccharimonadales bacterium]